ncbi:hypothetical protein Tco_1507335 [Tanacetum coccineum]
MGHLGICWDLNVSHLVLPREEFILPSLVITASVEDSTARRNMRMEQYLTFTDHALWEVIVNGDSVSPVASASTDMHDEHLLKFHAYKDAMSYEGAIKNRFRGNKESKKMQKTILKHNFENFAASSQEGLDKTYDRFQKLISRLEIHGEVISQKDANLKLAPRKDSWDRILDAQRRNAPVDTSTTNALVVQDGIEKDDLKLNQEKFETSSKNLTKLLNCQITAKDKTGLGFDEQVNESEVLDNVFDSHESDGDDNPVNDRFKRLRDIMQSPLPTLGTTCPQDLTYLLLDSKDIVEKSKTVSDNDSMFRPKSDQTKLKFTKINFVKSGENVKSVNKKNTHRKLATARPVNTAAPKSKVNDALPITYSYFKAHSPVRRNFNQKWAAKTNNFNEKVNTVKVNNVTTVGPKAVVSAAVGNGENAVKSLAC